MVSMILVTGAGGSIGSEICRQLDKPILFEHSEYALFQVWQETGGMPVLGDCKDFAHLRRICDAFNPDIIHAAAYKHVPLLENDNAFIAARNNILGTLNTVRACRGKYVLISTDKAVAPSCIMGFTKRICELIVNEYKGVIVRFGNVMGSAGSVIPKFQAQIDYGGPLTVTHPDVTRYMMSIADAVRLVIAIYRLNQPGIYLLNMGEPQSILGLAKHMIGERPIPIKFIGLQPGEKLHEELAYPEERRIQVTPDIYRLEHSTLPVSHEAERWLNRPFANYEETLEWLSSLATYGHGQTVKSRPQWARAASWPES